MGRANIDVEPVLLLSEGAPEQDVLGILRERWSRQCG
jgi:hypothetical protein